MRSVLTSDSFYICFLLLFHDYCASLLLWRLRFPFMSDLPRGCFACCSIIFSALVEVCGFAPSLVALAPNFWGFDFCPRRTDRNFERNCTQQLKLRENFHLLLLLGISVSYNICQTKYLLFSICLSNLSVALVLYTIIWMRRNARIVHMYLR